MLLFNVCWQCSDRGENQGHSRSVLPTSTSPARVWRRASRHLDSDETVLERRTLGKTFFQRHCEKTQSRQWRKVIVALYWSSLVQNPYTSYESKKKNGVSVLICLPTLLLHTQCFRKKKQISVRLALSVVSQYIIERWFHFPSQLSWRKCQMANFVWNFHVVGSST